MSELRIPSLDYLSPLDRNTVIAIRTEFEDGWDGDLERLDKLLTRVEEPLRDVLLAELVRADLQLRTERGNSIALGDYLSRFPDRPWLVRLDPNREEATLVSGVRLETGDVTGTFHNENSDGSPILVGAHQAGQIPGYEILRELGRGGMGVVYQARHLSLDRVVALKMILAGSHAGAEDLTRFRTEAEAVARLLHPGIVQIFEVDEHRGLPYLALEYCPGGSLQDKLEGALFPADEAALLLEQLAGAVQSAHDKGVIHRDLKPANILFSENGTPKITDFGLAKKLDEQGKTGTGSVLGTPAYMSPEQAKGETKAIGPATDIYSLGVILYECLTGRPPIKSSTPLETLMQVVNDEHVSPRQLEAKIPVDLETICSKCLQKEPSARYDSARALQEDLERFRQGHAILAKPVSRWERSRKWIVRNPLVASLFATVFVVLLGGILVSSLLALRANRNASAAERARRTAENLANQEAAARRRADEERDRAEHMVYSSRLDRARRSWLEGDAQAAWFHLESTRWDFRGWEYDYLFTRLGKGVCPLWAHADSVNAVAFSEDGTRIASAGKAREVVLWDALTGEALRTLEGHREEVTSVAFRPDGKHLITGSADQTVRVWEVATGKLIRTLEGHIGGLLTVEYSRDGTRVAGGGYGGIVRVWNADTGKELFALEAFDGAVHCLDFHPDGTTLVVGYSEKILRVWDLATRKTTTTLQGHDDEVLAVEFDPKGDRIVSAAKGGAVKLWNPATGKSVLEFQAHHHATTGVSFHPNGHRLATTGWDGLVKIWDSTTGTRLFSLPGHTDRVYSVSYGPEGNRLVSGGRDASVRIWNANPAQDTPAFEGHTEGILSVAFDLDGARIVSGGMDKTVRVWETSTGKPLHTLTGHEGVVTGVAFALDGKRIASGSWDRTVRLWDSITGKELHSLEGHDGLIIDIAVSPDGKRIASASVDRTVRVWDAESGTALAILRGHTDNVVSVAFHPDGKRIASGGKDKSVRVWNADTGKTLLTLRGHSNDVSGLAFSPDGKRLVSSSGDRTVRVWEANTGRELFSFEGHGHYVTGVAFSPDGTRIATSSDDSTVKLWDAEFGQLTYTLEGHAGGVTEVKFHPEGTHLVTGSWDKTVRVWEATDHQSSYLLRGHPGDLIRAGYSESGTTILGVDKSGKEFRWDAKTGVRLREGARPRTTARHNDGKSVLVIGARAFVIDHARQQRADTRTRDKLRAWASPTADNR